MVADNTHGRSIRAVELCRLGMVLGGVAVLRGLEGRFDKGRLHLIVGHNGSGKSTLLRVLATMLSPSFGCVRYEGIEVDKVRSCLGLVSHESLLYPSLTGEENLQFAAGIHDLGLDRVRQMEQRFGLETVGKRPVGRMSRGQRQRVALARGLLHDPSLILLDEPTTGLDEQGLEMLLGVVRERVDQGSLVLLVTHEPMLFSDMKTRIWKLCRGRWAAKGKDAAMTG